MYCLPFSFHLDNDMFAFPNLKIPLLNSFASPTFFRINVKQDPESLWSWSDSGESQLPQNRGVAQEKSLHFPSSVTLAGPGCILPTGPFQDEPRSNQWRQEQTLVKSSCNLLPSSLLSETPRENFSKKLAKSKSFLGDIYVCIISPSISVCVVQNYEIIECILCFLHLASFDLRHDQCLVKHRYFWSYLFSTEFLSLSIIYVYYQ